MTPLAPRRLVPLAALAVLVLALVGAPAEASDGDLPPDQVFDLVRTAESTDSAQHRSLAIEDLGRLAGVDAVPAVLALARRSWDCRRQAWAAVTEILRRHDDRRSWSRVESRLNELPPESRARLLSLAADTHSAYARSLLSRHLGRDPYLDPVVISGLERMPAAGSDPTVLQGLRGLLHSDRANLRRDSARALGRFGDVESLPRLAELLAEGDPVVAEEAHWALREVSGLPLPPDAARWKTWVNEELGWWETKSAATFDALGSGDPAKVLAAINELSLHTLYPERRKAALEALLDHSHGPVRKAAEAALAGSMRGFAGGGGGAAGAAAEASAPRPRSSPRSHCLRRRRGAGRTVRSPRRRPAPVRCERPSWSAWGSSSCFSSGSRAT